MTNEVILSSLQAALAVDETQEKALAEYKSMPAFMPRIQLMQASSGPVAEDKAKRGDFVLFKGKELIILGKEFVSVPLTFRMKAMQFKPDVKAFYNIASPSYQEIKARSQEPNSNCSVGPEWLLWLAEQQMFATFHLGSASSQTQSKTVLAMAKELKATRFYSEITKSKKNGNSWANLLVEPNSIQVDLPDHEYIKAQADIFKKPKDEEVELAGTGEKTDDGEARVD